MTAPSPHPPFERAPALSGLSGVRHGFFGRRGGVSKGLFDSLNCGLGSSDDPNAVQTNRERIAGAVGVSAERLLTVYQIHSPHCIPVRGPWPGGKSAEGDAMVTREPGLALGVLAADCVPVLFADPAAGVIGAAHAGWKGALGGVLEATIDVMEAEGADRARIHAAIGPSIGPEAYEVGAEFEARFLDADGANARFFTPGRPGHAQFDLPAYVRARLERSSLGLVDGLGHCTYTDEMRYFSYRRTTHRKEPDYGRNLSVIALVPEAGA